MTDNLEYYERRAREEADAAEAAASAEAASAHRLLAIEYEAQARELRSRTEAIVRDGEKAKTPTLAGDEGGRRPKLSIR